MHSELIAEIDALKRPFANENGLTLKEQRIAYAAMDAVADLLRHHQQAQPTPQRGRGMGNEQLAEAVRLLD